MVRKITGYEIIRCFLNDYSKEYHLREFARLLKKPHQTIKPYVEKLLREKILIKNKKGNIIEYKLNFKNKLIYNYLVIAEKQRLIKRLNEDIILKVLFEKLSDFFKENVFVIFGSSTEKLHKGSDIDLLIIGKSKVDDILKEFEEIYNKKIHKIQVKTLDELDNVFVKEIYKKHLIFNNTETTVRFFGGLYEKNRLV